MKKIICAMGAAALIGLGAGAANASTVIYHLTEDACSGGCGLASGASYGTITVTGVGTDVLNFDVQLASGIYFNKAGGAKAELFSIAGASTIGISNILATNDHNNPATTSTTFFSAPSSEHAGSKQANGALGKFQYAINPNGSNNSSIATKGYNELDFTVTGAPGSKLSLALSDLGKKVSDFYYAADIYGSNGRTGYVGATYFETIGASAVPEPASWAMMMVGVAGVGGLLRRKRALAGQTTAA